MEKVFDSAGFYGPHITFVIGFTSLLKQPKFIASYLVFTTINMLINKILKYSIQQPRPVNGKSFIENENYSGADKYGMPSAHAQSVLFSTTYLYLVKKSIIGLIIELYICFLTLYQRWSYNRHTIEQLLVGSFIGIINAYFSVTITKKFLQ